MAFNTSTYKLIRKMRPFDFFDVITRGVCPEIKEEAMAEIRRMYGEYYINNWMNGTKIEPLCMYLSDAGFSAMVTKERGQELEKEFKSWGLFYEVWSKWYGGEWYKVGFNFTYDAFEKLYPEWERNRKIKEILDET